MNRAALFILTVLFCSCGKKAPEQQTTPKVEPTEATLTLGMETVKKAYNEVRYAEAVRVYTAELAPEEAKPVPSWVQLSHLNNQLGRVLDNCGQYDHALEYYQKSLAILLKKLGPNHPHTKLVKDQLDELAKEPENKD